MPLNKAADLYFSWKSAKNSTTTIQRERRIFNAILKAFGGSRPVRSIKLFHLRQYQQDRRKHISHMKQPVTARTVNYELDLLRGLMKYTGCWTPELMAGYEALTEVKSQAGKFASEQASECGFQRLKQAMENLSQNTVTGILNSLKIRSIDRISDFQTLHALLLKMEAAIKTQTS